MPKVYVTQNTQLNLTPALRFGEIIVLATWEFNGLWSPIAGMEAVKAMKAKLADYDPTSDFILPIGDPLNMGAAFAIVAVNHGRVRVLKWQKQNREYIPVEVAI